MTETYTGLTWDHPRGYEALVAAARQLERRNASIRIDWHTQPLEGFESHPIEALCERFDLVVMDHPHLGEALRAECLQPWDALLPEGFIAELERTTVGPCLASYRLENRLWALPLDAATQVMAAREDLLPGPLPRTWDEVLSLAQRHGRVALSLAGPHAILSYFSIAAALGEPPQSVEPARLVSEATGIHALELMEAIVRRAPDSVANCNPIQLLEHMGGASDVALCPLVYGYVNYASVARHPRLVFGDAPRAGIDGRPGSTLGGTGIALARRRRPHRELVEHLCWLLGEEAQSGFIPAHQGQPSRRQAWLDDAVNQPVGDFYRNTIVTVEDAFLRPRHDGYIEFQAEASHVLRRKLCREQPARIASTIQHLFEKSLAVSSRTPPSG